MAFPIIAGLRLLAVRGASMARGLSGAGQVARVLLRKFLSGDDDERRREILRGVMRTVASMRVHVDTRQSVAYLNDLQRRKIPRMTAIALTRTAKELQKILEAEVTRVFDRPVAYTKRAFATRPATTGNLTAEVFIKTNQARYLAPQVTGGRRRPKRSEQKFTQDADSPGMYWVPGEGIRLNAHGNISLAQVLKIAQSLRKAKRDVFMGQPNPSLPYGIWERLPRKRGMGGGIKPLLVQVRPPNYTKRLDMEGIAKRHAQEIFNREFAKAWAQYK